MTRVVKCVKPAQGLEVGKLYEVSCDNYDLIHIVGGDGYAKQHFEYVKAVKADGNWYELVSKITRHSEKVNLPDGAPMHFYSPFVKFTFSQLPPTEPVVPERRTRTFAKDRTPPSQIGGSHYTKLKIQPFEFIRANNLDFFEGNVVKYLSRYQHKNGNEDLDKAIHYVRECDGQEPNDGCTYKMSIHDYCKANDLPIEVDEVLHWLMYGHGGMDDVIKCIKELKK